MGEYKECCVKGCSRNCLAGGPSSAGWVMDSGWHWWCPQCAHAAALLAEVLGVQFQDGQQDWRLSEDELDPFEDELDPFEIVAIN